MSQEGVSKDVEDRLRNERKRHREPGAVPWPARSNQTSTAFDIWNQSFLKSLCRSITAHQFDTPPKRVLDLGCGGGLWILEAAQQWKTTEFVGLDVEHKQPNFLHLLKPGIIDLVESEALNDVSGRIRWEHTNLLEHLPFEDGYFDYVRICNIALGVPEDEWPDLFQEVARIMAPGAPLEIIEDDLVFPTGPARRQLFSDNSLLQIPISFEDTSRMSENGDVFTATVVSLNSPISTVSTTAPWNSNSSTSVARVGDPGLEETDIIHPNSQQAKSMRRVLKNQRRESGKSIDELADFMDPQDHSKLKISWNQMLQHRWIASKPLSVIPLFLSGEFREVRSHPTLYVPIPSNSDSITSNDSSSSSHSDSEPEFILDLKAHALRKRSIDNLNLGSGYGYGDERSGNSMQNDSAVMHAWAGMHLARTVNIIESCKEAIWEEYRKLDLMFPDMEKYDLRDEFEAAWRNWYSDMTDRIGMRSKINRTFGWSLPFEIAQELPDWRIWRMRLGKVAESDIMCFVADDSQKENDEDICRCLKGFVAWKSSDVTSGSK